LNCGVLGAKDIPVFTYRGNRGSNPLGDAKLILRKPHILLGLFLLLRLGHPPALPRDNRGELVLSIAEGNRLGDAERVGLKKDCQRRGLMPASGIQRL